VLVRTHTRSTTHMPVCHFSWALTWQLFWQFLTLPFSVWSEKGCLWCLGAVSWIGAFWQCS
jgi:hypothetical protein